MLDNCHYEAQGCAEGRSWRTMRVGRSGVVVGIEMAQGIQSHHQLKEVWAWIAVHKVWHSVRLPHSIWIHRKLTFLLATADDRWEMSAFCSGPYYTLCFQLVIFLFLSLRTLLSWTDLFIGKSPIDVRAVCPCLIKVWCKLEVCSATQ